MITGGKGSSQTQTMPRACPGADLRERDRAGVPLGAHGEHMPGGGEAKHIVDQQTGKARRNLEMG